MQHFFPSRGPGTAIYEKLLGGNIDQGQLYVPPAYYQTGSSAAVQLNAAADWAAMRFSSDVDMEISSLDIYVSAVGTQGDITCAIYSHDSSNDEPDSSLQAFGTVDSGSGAGWVRLSISSSSRYQCAAGGTYWIVIKGSAGVDFSLSARRWHTGIGSMFPDGVKCLSSSDSGANWSQIQQDSKDACLNLIINGQSDHVPQLYYGRKDGQYVYIPGSGLMEIPEEGISLDCSALTADTEYNLFLYDNSGTLELEASTTGRTRVDGITVKTGDTEKRFLGKIYPKEIQTGKQGPVDVMDRRLVAWPGRSCLVGKYTPFSSETYYIPSATATWFKWNNNDDYTVEILAVESARIQLVAQSAIESAGRMNISFGIDSTTPSELQSNMHQYLDGNQTSCHLACSLSERVHSIYSLVSVGNAATRLYLFFTGGTYNDTYRAVVLGEIK